MKFLITSSLSAVVLSVLPISAFASTLAPVGPWRVSIIPETLLDASKIIPPPSLGDYGFEFRFQAKANSVLNPPGSFNNSLALIVANFSRDYKLSDTGPSDLVQLTSHLKGSLFTNDPENASFSIVQAFVQFPVLSSQSYQGAAAIGNGLVLIDGEQQNAASLRDGTYVFNANLTSQVSAGGNQPGTYSIADFLSTFDANISVITVPEPSQLPGALFFATLSAGYLLKCKRRNKIS